MMRQLLMICFLITMLSSNVVYSQSLDSLWSVWNNKSQPDTTRLKIIKELGQKYRFINPDTSIYLTKQHYRLAGKLKARGAQVRALTIRGQSFYRLGKYDKAIDVYNRALPIADSLGYVRGKGIILNGLGISYSEIGNIPKAINNLTKSLKTLKQLGVNSSVASILNNIANIHTTQENLDKAKKYFKRALKQSRKKGINRHIVNINNNLGRIYFEKNALDTALTYFDSSIIIADSLNYLDGKADALQQKGDIYKQKGNYDKALKGYQKSLSIYKDNSNKQGISIIYRSKAELYLDKEAYGKAINYAEMSLDLAKSINNAESIKYANEVLYKAYKKQGDYTESLAAYEQFISIRDSMNSEQNQRAVIRKEYQYKYEKQALKDSLEFAKKQAVKNMKIEKQEAELNQQQIALASTGGGLLLILGLAYAIYKGKKRSDDLLLNILPSETAKELKKKGYVDARQFDEVTVLFTDFKDFTSIAENKSPNELVADIDECFRAFDEIMEKYGIEKIKTIGDAYMAAGGLPVPNNVKPEKVVQAALEMRDFMIKYKQEKGKQGFDMRIGVHTGPVVAGIVGIKKFQYDIWGDTVNMASRMETSGDTDRVNISGATYERVKDKFTCEHRGKIEAKNKGEVDMYFVERT